VCIASDLSGLDTERETDNDRFKMGRDGDQYLVPFQCDLCLFRTLKGRDPVGGNDRDDTLMCCLRRANLDAMWGREPSTVAANLNNVVKLNKIWKSIGVRPTFETRGPFPLKDIYGVSIAVGMLMMSLESGSYANYKQFATIRKLRSAYSNMYHASVKGCREKASLNDKGKRTMLTEVPTNTLWFERFALGCLKRMGQEIHQDLALSMDVMLKMQELFYEEMRTALDDNRKLMLTSVWCYCVIAFGGSFRGNEVFLTDMEGLIHSLDRGRDDGDDCIFIPLLGRFKGETGEKYHLTPLANVTASGLKIRKALELFVEEKLKWNETRGPAFKIRSFGRKSLPRAYEEIILDHIALVQLENPNLIPAEVDVNTEYGISRSFRRGSATQARLKGVSSDDIDLINRWRNVEKAGGRKPAMRMRDHYVEIRQLVPALTRYSKAL